MIAHGDVLWIRQGFKCDISMSWLCK